MSKSSIYSWWVGFPHDMAVFLGGYHQWSEFGPSQFLEFIAIRCFASECYCVYTRVTRDNVVTHSRFWRYIELLKDIRLDVYPQLGTRKPGIISNDPHPCFNTFLVVSTRFECNRQVGLKTSLLAKLAIGKSKFCGDWKIQVLRWQTQMDLVANPIPWWFRSLFSWISCGHFGRTTSQLHFPTHPDLVLMNKHDTTVVNSWIRFCSCERLGQIGQSPLKLRAQGVLWRDGPTMGYQ